MVYCSSHFGCNPKFQQNSLKKLRISLSSVVDSSSLVSFRNVLKYLPRSKSGSWWIWRVSMTQWIKYLRLQSLSKTETTLPKVAPSSLSANVRLSAPLIGNQHESNLFAICRSTERIFFSRNFLSICSELVVFEYALLEGDSSAARRIPAEFNLRA